MINPHRILWVKAVPTAHVHELNEQGVPFRTGAIRLVGKTYNTEAAAYLVNPDGAKLVYHSHYVKCLKEGSLLPMDEQTALACGVAFNKDV